MPNFPKFKIRIPDESNIHALPVLQVLSTYIGLKTVQSMKNNLKSTGIVPVLVYGYSKIKFASKSSLLRSQESPVNRFSNVLNFDTITLHI